jgi:phospholipid/cholesterol/gamma-HCH transport system permease protein
MAGAHAVVPAPARQPRTAAWLATVGARVQAAGQGARLTLSLVGELLLAFGALLRGRSDMRVADLAWQLEQTGPRSVPIVALVSAMVGLILAYMGAAQLQQFGATSFAADLMTLGVVREVAALLTGIVLSGRVGAAFAAQLGSMRAGDELDALRTLGVDPVSHLVLPRVLALLVVAPLLTLVAAAMGLLVGWAATTQIYGVGSAEYLTRSANTLTGAHLGVGLLKGSVYGVLVALAGCRQGLHAGKSAQAVGDATTRAVVQSIVWIVIAASVLTVVLQRWGI